MKFKRLWAGYAVAAGKYQLADHKAIRLLGQRTGETQNTYAYKPFVTTCKKSAADLMTLVFPERWNIEEFFNCESTLGRNRASTLNLNVRIDGDIRVKDDTIIVTFYNAPEANALREHYENLPQKLEAEGLNPKVPWLYNFKVDFRFK